METSKFVENAVNISIAVIVAGSVALPIITGVTIATGTANKAAMDTVIGVIPLFMLIGVLMGSIAVFIRSKNGGSGKVRSRRKAKRR